MLLCVAQLDSIQTLSYPRSDIQCPTRGRESGIVENNKSIKYIIEICAVVSLSLCGRGGSCGGQMATGVVFPLRRALIHISPSFTKSSNYRAYVRRRRSISANNCGSRSDFFFYFFLFLRWILRKEISRR